MKKIFLLVSFAFIFGLVRGQQSSLQSLDMNLENYQYPFPVQFLPLRLQNENLKMAYMDVKPKVANGKVIVLLHGKNFNGAYWEQTAKVLQQNGFRVIIPDQIGFGKSSKPEHLQYSFQLLASNTKKILDTLQIKKTIILGNSMGGMVAARFALMYPETVEKLILENPIGLEDYKRQVPYQSVDKWYQTELKANFESIKKYQLNSYYDGKWKSDYDKWVNIPAGQTLHKDYPRVAWNAALTYDLIMTQPVVYELQDISAPTLLIIGQRDRTAVGKNMANPEVQKTMGNFPALGKRTQKLIKNCQLVELDNIGHLPHIENFERFIEPLLNFIKQP